MDSAISLSLDKDTMTMVMKARPPSRNRRLGGFLPLKKSVQVDGG